MEKVYGTENRNDQLIVFGTGKCVLIFGYGEENGQGYDYRHTFEQKPSKEEVYRVIEQQVNAETDAKILDGFEWEGQKVYLSTENQFNFKAAYDLAYQTRGLNLPLKFKLGEDSKGSAVYHTFVTEEELTEFYTSAMVYINQVLNEGWARKDEALRWVETLDI